MKPWVVVHPTDGVAYVRSSWPDVVVADHGIAVASAEATRRAARLRSEVLPFARAIAALAASHPTAAPDATWLACTVQACVAVPSLCTEAMAGTLRAVAALAHAAADASRSASHNQRARIHDAIEATCRLAAEVCVS